MTARALAFLGMAALLSSCAHESVTGPGPVALQPVPVVAPMPLTQVVPEILEPLPADARPDYEHGCRQTQEHVLIDMTVSYGSEWVEVRAVPLWGPYHGPLLPVPRRCLDRAIGAGGPEWLDAELEGPGGGPHGGHIEQGDPYVYRVLRGTRGRVLACARVGAACGKATISSRAASAGP